MVRTRSILVASLVFLVSVTVSLSLGCDRQASDTPEPAEPWRFDSQSAPYSIEVPGEWEDVPPEELNEFADFAVTVSDRFFAIVIPQELPQYEDVESPDAQALKRASVGLLEKRIDQFEVQREGPLKLGDQPALSVFAEGMDDGEAVQYIASYATRGEVAYQIVAWGPKRQQDGLVQATEALLAGWQFTDEAPSPDADEPADEEPADDQTADEEPARP